MLSVFFPRLGLSVLNRNFSFTLLVQLPPEIREFLRVIPIEPTIISELCAAEAAIKLPVFENVVLLVPFCSHDVCNATKQPPVPQFWPIRQRTANV